MLRSLIAAEFDVRCGVAAQVAKHSCPSEPVPNVSFLQRYIPEIQKQVQAGQGMFKQLLEVRRIDQELPGEVYKLCLETLRS